MAIAEGFSTLQGLRRVLPPSHTSIGDLLAAFQMRIVYACLRTHCLLVDTAPRPRKRIMLKQDILSRPEYASRNRLDLGLRTPSVMEQSHVIVVVVVCLLAFCVLIFLFLYSRRYRVSLDMINNDDRV
jgi:hypothetical protein